METLPITELRYMLDAIRKKKQKRRNPWFQNWTYRPVFSAEELDRFTDIVKTAISKLELLQAGNCELAAELEAEREKTERIRIAFLSACEAIQHAESTTDSFCAECGREKGTDGNCPSCPPF